MPDIVSKGGRDEGEAVRQDHLGGSHRKASCYSYELFHSQMKVSIASRLFAPLAWWRVGGRPQSEVPQRWTEQLSLLALLTRWLCVSVKCS